LMPARADSIMSLARAPGKTWVLSTVIPSPLLLDNY